MKILKLIKKLPVVLLLSACGKAWIPTGDFQGTLTRECEPIYLERELSKPNINSTERLKIFQDHLGRCGDQLTRNAHSSFQELFQSMNVEYDYSKNPHHENMELVELDGIRVTFELLMKTGEAPRPLVIVKCGLQCDPGDPSLRLLAATLYDEGPFHVMLVPNITGTTFQKNNGVIAFGGLDEGAQIFRLSRYVRSAGFKYANRVSSVHVLGASLGGHAALYSSLYNSLNRKNDGLSYIDSVTALCPVVDLEASVRGLYSGGFLSGIFSKFFWQQFEEIGGSVPVAGRIVNLPKEERAMRKIPDLIASGALEYYKSVSKNPDWTFAPFNGLQIQNEKDLWSYNRFQNFAEQVDTPVLVWAADNDHIVSANANAEILRNVIANRNDSTVQVMKTELGSHCVFQDAYGWRTVGTFLRAMILGNSPEMNSRRVDKKLPIKFVSTVGSPQVGEKGRLRISIQWNAIQGSREIELSNRSKFVCPWGHDQNAICYESGRFRVNLDDLELSQISTPQSLIETQALTRWLNAHVWVLGHDTSRDIAAYENPEFAWIRDHQ